MHRLCTLPRTLEPDSGRAAKGIAPTTKLRLPVPRGTRKKRAAVCADGSNQTANDLMIASRGSQLPAISSRTWHLHFRSVDLAS